MQPIQTVSDVHATFDDYNNNKDLNIVRKKHHSQFSDNVKPDKVVYKEQTQKVVKATEMDRMF